MFRRCLCKILGRQFSYLLLAIAAAGAPAQAALSRPAAPQAPSGSAVASLGPGDTFSMGAISHEAFLASDWSQHPAQEAWPPLAPPGPLDLTSEAPASIRELPPAPGSASLILSGLLTLGAWGALRTARDARWAALPAWYHEHAGQVGYSVPFEFQMKLQPVGSVLGMIAFAPAPPATRFYQPDAEYRIRSPQQTPLALAPRSPPRR